MLKFKAGSFYRAIAGIRNIGAAINSWENDQTENRINVNDPIDELTSKAVVANLKEIQNSLLVLGTRVTAMALDRLLRSLSGLHAIPSPPTYAEVAKRFYEVDSRLRDELSLVTAFVLKPDQVELFEPPEPLFGPDFAAKFASAGVYEVDEAAKCRALRRDTAAVFHLMRCMEIGIRTVAKCLSIPDPVTGSDRNWFQILTKIKAAMDTKTRAATWQPGDKTIFESAYGSLDAVRVAWRNPTMHVENKYNPEESEHIYIAVRAFMKNLVSRMDEQGQPAA